MYTMECYLAVEGNEVLIHVMSLENKIHINFQTR